MPWTCPQCERVFKNRAQWHSCATADLTEHLKNKSPLVKATLDILLQRVQAFGGVTLNPVRTSIQVKSTATFLSIQLKKDRVVVEFFLASAVEEPPIYRLVRLSKGRVLHFAVLEDPSEVDARLLRWVKESYDLVARQAEPSTNASTPNRQTKARTPRRA